MSYLVILVPNKYFSTYSNFVGSWDGISFEVSKPSPASRLLSWHQIRILLVSPQEASLVRSSRVENIGGSGPFWYHTISPGSKCPMETSLVGVEGSYRASEWGS